MNKRFLNYNDILRAEITTSKRTKKEIINCFLRFEQLINILLKLNYHIDSKESSSEETPGNLFFSFAYGKYLEAPYSLHACHSLMERGHYLNAMIQLRSLLDYFVSCRYLYKHPQHVAPYRSGQKCLVDGKEKWLGTNELYGYFSKNFYDCYYGDMLSCLNHGKGATEIFRIDRSNPQKARVILVPEFNLKYALSIINHLIAIAYGYLSHWELFFEGRTLPLPPELAKERSETIAWLKEQHQQQPQKYPESAAWVEGMSKIIGLS